MTKKIPFTISLALMAFLVNGLAISQAQAAVYTFDEDFSATTYKDNANTTADWNTIEGKATLSSSYTINDWSSYFQNFSGPVTAIDDNNYVQMIGGGNGSLNLIPSGVLSSFEDKSDQLIGFSEIDINAIAWSSKLGWLIGGGTDLGSGGSSGPKLNKLENTNSTGEDLSSDLSALNFNSVSDIACNSNECLIIGTPGKLAKYDGASFTDLSNNIDFNTIYKDKVKWNGDYWLIAGTNYSAGSNDYIGKIYKYNGSVFTKITEDTMFVGQGPSNFDMTWNGEEWLIARGYSPIKLYKYNGSAFEDLSSQFNKFVSSGDIISPTVYWTGKAWLISGGTYFKHFIRYDGTSMTDVINLLENFSGSSINIIASKYSTSFNQFFVGGSINSPKLNLVNELGYKMSSVVQSKKNNTISETITEATVSVDDIKSSDTSIVYYLSANGGINWEQVTSGQQHTFSNSGTDLRWKGILSTRDTAISPYIDSISIYYETSPSIKVISPNGGEIIEERRIYNIIWTASDDIPTVDISICKFSLGSGCLAYIAKNVKNTGVYSWDTSSSLITLPNSLGRLIEGNDYKIYIRSSTDSNIVDESDSYFTVKSAIQFITVVSPSDDERLEKLKTYRIIWTSSSNIDLVIFKLYKGGEFIEYLTHGWSDNTGIYNWYVPAHFTNGDDYKIRIVSATEGPPYYEGGVYGESNGFFSISTSTPTPEPTPTPTPEPIPGTCLPDNTLIKLPSDPRIYVVINCQKKWIRTLEEFQQGGYQWDSVQEVSSPVISAYADYLEATANLLRAIGQQRVYRIIDDKRLWVPTISAFNAQGLKWDDIQDVNESEVNQYPRLILAKAVGDPRVYYFTENGLKKHIPSVVVFNSYSSNRWEDIVEITLTELNAYPDVILIRADGDPKVYKLENNQRRWIRTAEAFNRIGLNWNEIASVNTTDLNAYTVGTDVY